MRNPDWVRDEVILAMDLYVRAGRKQLSANHADVIRLSELLNALPLHDQSKRDVSFRNADGIEMILGNLLGVDPAQPQGGLGRNNRLQKQVWDDFIDRLPALRQTAEAIERFANHDVQELDPEESLGEQDTFLEGGLLTRLHRVRERNTAVVARKKAQVLAQCGMLKCEACGFDFEEAYGDLGRGFAECHHRLPLAESAFVRASRLNDLAIVCANCHRMLHRACTPMTVEVLRELLSKRRVAGHTPVDTSYANADLS